MAPVRRHLATAARGIALSCDGLQQLLVWRYAQRQAECAITIVEVKPVGTGTAVLGCRDLHAFVTCAGNLKKDFVLALEHDLLIVRAARSKHRPVKTQQRVATETGA